MTLEQLQSIFPSATAETWHQHDFGRGWVQNTAKVADTAFVGPYALVYENAWVYDNAWISERARVYGNAKVFGDADIGDSARVFGNAQVFGNAKVCGDAKVCDNAVVCGDAVVWVDTQGIGTTSVKLSRRAIALEVLAACIPKGDDPDTKTACVIDYGTGFVYSANQLPSGIAFTPERVKRPAKYRFIMHAERRAIDLAALDGNRLAGATAYINWFPCSICASSLIQAGIVHLVCDRQAYEARINDPVYGFAESMEMLNEAGVDIQWI